jgi:hypothetical protein
MADLKQCHRPDNRRGRILSYAASACIAALLACGGDYAHGQAGSYRGTLTLSRDGARTGEAATSRA